MCIRLIDLFDQAILYLHIHSIEGARERLREYGIRTATDLEQVCNSQNDSDNTEFFKVLDNLPNLDVLQNVERLRIILQALKDDEWIAYLQNWRSFSQVNLHAFTFHDFAKIVGPKPEDAIAPFGN